METTPKRAYRWSLLVAVLSFACASTAWAAPVGLGFRGTLEDGGLFDGYVVYGDQDVEQVSPENADGVLGFGRFQGGQWHVDVRGGATTINAHLDNTTGGRTPVETRESPSMISFFVLGPEAGELPRLSLMFEARAGYDADVQPVLSDIVGFYFSLTNGAQTAFSGYHDSTGVFTRVAAIDKIWDATSELTAVPVPGALGLMVGAMGLLAPALRRRRDKQRAA